MSENLYVYYEDRKVGILQPDDRRQLSFTYSSEWLSDSRSFPISKSLPLEADTYEAHSFFVNLLPEGGFREYICNQLGISVENDFELLKQIGGECAGALRVVEEEQGGVYSDTDYKKIEGFKSVEALLSMPLIESREARLSLAGAQYKLPVYWDNGILYLPIHQSPSSHILKFANINCKKLPEVEFLVTCLARSAGLNVVDISLCPYGNNKLAISSLRYDRFRDENQHLRRLHQEDFCQVLGVPAMLKYENEGGPSLVDCIEVIRTYSDDVICNTNQFLEWIVFNVLVGNCDAHGKNLSFLYRDGQTHIAPHYDLVATINYPRISKKMAMSIGGEWVVQNVSRKHWANQAKAMGIKPQKFFDLVAGLSAHIVSNIEAEFSAHNAINERFRDRVRVLIVKQCQRIQKGTLACGVR